MKHQMHLCNCKMWIKQAGTGACNLKYLPFFLAFLNKRQIFQVICAGDSLYKRGDSVVPPDTLR